MKNLFNLVFLSFLFIVIQNKSFAQKSYGDLYHPEANAAQDIDQLTKQAKQENKHIILQVGGNWCVWCYRFHDFVKEHSVLQELVDQNYLVYHLNFSKENKNEALLEQYQFPQRFGFPVLVILDSEGQLLHTQNSALLEAGDGYDIKKIEEFFKGWTKKALDPVSYKK